QLSLALEKCLFQAPPLAQIADDTCEIFHAIGYERAYCQVDRKEGAVLSLTLNLAPDTDDLLPAGFDIIGQVGVMLLAIWRRHQNAYFLAKQLLRLVAEQPLRRRIHRLVCSALVDP